MAILETSGHRLNIGDHVKMNIDFIGKGDLDGVEFTLSGKNYWRYMNEHPDEVYTVTGYDSENDQYILSGFMSDNTWYADELIHVPDAQSIFELIKNMTLEEMRDNLFALVLALCEEGVPSADMIEDWLNSKPSGLE